MACAALCLVESGFLSPPELGSKPEAAFRLTLLPGIIDSLQTKKEDEALARALVGLAAIEQLSLDRGSWTIAEPMLLEEPAPMASFTGRQLPTGSELPFTRLFDSRAVDALVGQVKDIDDYLERRKKLGKRGSSSGNTAKEEADEGEKPKPQGGGKGKGKAKAKASADKLGSPRDGSPLTDPQSLSAGNRAVRVPGAETSTVDVSALWLSLPRWLLGEATLLQFFSLALSQKHQGRKLLPPPLPSRCRCRTLRSTRRGLEGGPRGLAELSSKQSIWWWPHCCG